jgi:ADP-dependent phosphofructokinase/glucokinase
MTTVASLTQPQQPRLHVELASMTDAPFVRHLLDTLLPRVDSLGLNEQELATTYEALGYNSHKWTRSQLSSKVPHADAVIDVITLIMNTYNTKGGLTRIHFHSLAFHIIATRYAYPSATVHIWVLLVHSIVLHQWSLIYVDVYQSIVMAVHGVMHPQQWPWVH